MAGTEPQTDQDYNQPAEHSHSHVQRRIHQSGYLPHFSFIFNGTTHIHLPPANGSFVMPTHAATPQDLRTTVGGTGVQTPAAGRGSSRAGCYKQIDPAPFLDVPEPEYGAQMNAFRPGSVTGGYNPGGPGANLTPGVQTPTVGFGPAGSSGVGNNQLTPNATLGFGGQTSQAQFLPEYDTQAAAPPAVDLGLNDGGFTSGAQMNAIWSGAVTGGYNPWEPGANLTPSVPTPAVGLGPAGSSGVGYNQLSPIVTLDFDGQTPQGPFVTEYDTQAAAPPPTLDHLFLPPSWATAANNDFAEDCLPSSCSDSFMDQIFRD